MGKAAALREEAIAAFKAADDLVVDDSGAAPENQERFDALMADGRAKMDAFRVQQAKEGTVLSLRETLSDIAGGIKGSGPIPFSAHTIESRRGRTLGEAFVESQEYAELKSNGALQSNDASFRMSPFQAAATDVIHTTPETGPASALVTPQYLPGILPLEQRPLTVRGLFGSGTTTSDSISYAQQTSFEPASGLAVKQSTSPTDAAGLKKQSSLGWTRLTSPVEGIATWVVTTRQAVADAGQVRALIDNQLRLMLGLEEEEQLLNGDGTSPNLSGIYDQAIQTSDVTGLTTNGEPNIDAIRNASRLVRVGLSRLTADAIVMHPTDSMYLDLTVDGESRYRIGNPFGQTGSSTIWGLRRVESEAIDEGHALVGAFRAGATVLERQGISILAADQHADFFVRNLIVLLIEERLGFPVFWPSAFVDLTLDTWSNVIGS